MQLAFTRRIMTVSSWYHRDVIGVLVAYEVLSLSFSRYYHSNTMCLFDLFGCGSCTKINFNNKFTLISSTCLGRQENLLNRSVLAVSISNASRACFQTTSQCPSLSISFANCQLATVHYTTSFRFAITSAHIDWLTFRAPANSLAQRQRAQSLWIPESGNILSEHSRQTISAIEKRFWKVSETANVAQQATVWSGQSREICQEQLVSSSSSRMRYDLCCCLLLLPLNGIYWRHVANMFFGVVVVIQHVIQYALIYLRCNFYQTNKYYIIIMIIIRSICSVRNGGSQHHTTAFNQFGQTLTNLIDATQIINVQLTVCCCVVGPFNNRGAWQTASLPLLAPSLTWCSHYMVNVSEYVWHNWRSYVT